MKKIISVIFLIQVLFLSCKKKSVDEPQPAPQQVTVPNKYAFGFGSTLSFEKTSAGFDTLLSLEATLDEIKPLQNNTIFPINANVKYNGVYTVYDNNILYDNNVTYNNCGNFFNQWVHSTWDVTCSETGNFTYTDSTTYPSFPNAQNIIVDTIRLSQDFSINVAGAGNYDDGHIEIMRSTTDDDVIFGGYAGPGAANFTIAQSDLLNSDLFIYPDKEVLVRLVFYKGHDVTINGKTMTFTRQLVYNYRCVGKY